MYIIYHVIDIDIYIYIDILFIMSYSAEKEK